MNFLGFLNHNQFISECYSNHIFIAPSKTDPITGETEGGAPTVLIEAQATGMPVIASDHADIPEIVINEKSGLIFKENDTNQLAESIIELIKMKNLWSQMGEYGRKHVFSQHDIEFIIPQVVLPLMPWHMHSLLSGQLPVIRLIEKFLHQPLEVNQVDSLLHLKNRQYYTLCRQL